nr:hypothetical protein GCM10025699_70450 [Microbacterium flavescens]
MDVETLSDADLTRRAATGSRQALSSLFDRHATTITRYAWALASSRTDVAEIVQDTFVTMWKRSGEMALPHDSLLPWLLVVCRGHALNPARIQAGAPSTPLADLLAPLEGDDARDKLRFVRAEIDALSPSTGSSASSAWSTVSRTPRPPPDSGCAPTPHACPAHARDCGRR